MTEKYDHKLTVPVVLFTFNRLDNAQKVFEKIAKAQPEKLYLVSDGPRGHVAGEAQKVDAVRSYLDSHVTWECEVIKDYASSNMGCGMRVSSAISNVFAHEETAIFLEDDCVPDDSFFRYCSEMLDYYKDNEDVLVISGNNQISGLYDMEDDYAFSHILNIWGWAGYRRTWDGFDIKIPGWPDDKKLPVWKEVYNRRTRWALSSEYDMVYQGRCNSWAYPLSYFMGKRKGYCIIPRVNMIENIGFSEDSTHTDRKPKWMDLRSHSAMFPIKHADQIVWSREFDDVLSRYYFSSAHIMRVKNMIGIDVNKSFVKEIKRIFGK